MKSKIYSDDSTVPEEMQKKNAVEHNRHCRGLCK